MKSKAWIAGALGAVLLGTMVPGGPAVAKKKKTGPVVVAEDADDDWGANAAAGIAPVGDALGQELVEAAIEAPGDGTLNFVIKVKSLPAPGGMPEITRYTWDMTLDGEYVNLDGKWSNYSRGACDPTSGQCPPPRDPGMQPFVVRGNCMSNGAVVVCEELGIVQASFDAGAGTITIPVPIELIGAKPGSKITHGAQADSGFSGVTAIPSAFYSQADMPLDTMPITKTFVVPGKKKKK